MDDHTPPPPLAGSRPWPMSLHPSCALIHRSMVVPPDAGASDRLSHTPHTPAGQLFPVHLPFGRSILVGFPSLSASISRFPSYRFFPPDIVPLLRFHPSLSAPISLPHPLCVSACSPSLPSSLLASSLLVKIASQSKPQGTTRDNREKERKDCGSPLPYLPN